VEILDILEIKNSFERDKEFKIINFDSEKQRDYWGYVFIG
jgi:hypothetical protein